MEKERRRTILLMDIITALIFFSLIGVFRPDIVVIIEVLFLIPYLIITKRKNALKHLLLAGLVSLTWMIIARKEYGYNQNMISLFGINTFSFFAWIIGLFGIYLIYSNVQEIIKCKNNYSKMLLFLVIYWPLLLFAETVSYNLFNIVNVSTTNYPGLPICNCLHASNIMKIAYFLMGPIYLILCEVLGLENPHKEKRKNIP